MNAPAQPRTRLDARGVSKHCGAVRALGDPRLTLNEGEILGTFGADGQKVCVAQAYFAVGDFM
ncbi:MAG: hypothetical protein HUJ24_05735 [Rhodobacteraceae bacterium]|nr:hypothetical protein [Paracoccaceae bacterium]